MKIDYKQPLTEEFIEDNQDTIDWQSISFRQKLSESFIEKYKDRVNWIYISSSQKLSESFIEKYQDKVSWINISFHQKLSEPFIEKFQNKVSWYNISCGQTLSESFIEKFQNKVDWCYISQYQKLSELFIEKYQDKIWFIHISLYHKLSYEFMLKFKHKIHFDLIPNQEDNRTLEEKLQDMNEYAKEYNLEIKDNYLYAFREHDQWNRGIFNKTIVYDKPGIYRDWKCDLSEYTQNSYGLGIFPEGNIKVRVHVSDWGIWVKDTNKGRVWAFELLETKG